jgi:glycerol-3-phosphate dehydrogenase (NAD(P)+)
MKVAILGAGAWGTALALSASASQPRRAGGTQQASDHAISLWVRDPAQAQAMQNDRSNARYLPGMAFPPGLSVRCTAEASLLSIAQSHDLIIIATPVAGLRATLDGLRASTTPIAWLCKGFEAPVNTGEFGLLPHEIHAQTAFISVANNGADSAESEGFSHTYSECAVLSGPSFAAEVARAQPAALVAASQSPALRQRLVDVFHSPNLRVYGSDDVVGVEVGGAVKNVLAIATGLCDGLSLGLNARAALITRGLAEMTRLGLALGAKPETFMGLSGLGDLVLTATGDLSRNRKVGLLLAQGQTLPQAVASLGHVAEGVYCARTVVQRAAHLGIDMPIAQSVVKLLDGNCNVREAVAQLMQREPRSEN